MTCDAGRGSVQYVLYVQKLTYSGMNSNYRKNNTNPIDTEANSAGRSVRACVARKPGE
jgi:CRISPR/Cas system-associated protein Cas7 (RAMP superfamily)